jgi:hypothetical protein
VSPRTEAAAITAAPAACAVACAAENRPAWAYLLAGLTITVAIAARLIPHFNTDERDEQRAGRDLEPEGP